MEIMVEAEKIVGAIGAGDYDRSLDNLARAILHRKGFLEQGGEQEAEFKVGQTAIINSPQNPKWNGIRFLIHTVTPKTVGGTTIGLPNPKSMQGRRVNFPKSDVMHPLTDGKQLQRKVAQIRKKAAAASPGKRVFKAPSEQRKRAAVKKASTPGRRKVSR